MVGVAVFVGVAVGVLVGVAVFVGVALGVFVGVCVGVEVVVGVDVGVTVDARGLVTMLLSTGVGASVACAAATLTTYRAPGVGMVTVTW